MVELALPNAHALAVMLLIVVALGLAGREFSAGEVAKLLLLVPLLMTRLEALDAWFGIDVTENASEAIAMNSRQCAG